jgi:hypothetical protein
MLILFYFYRIIIYIIYDEVDMGDLGEWDELIDDIQEVCIQTLYEKTGFILHFDSQT